MFAARQEEELFAKQMSLTDSTEVLFVVELPLEGPLTLGDECDEIGLSWELELH